MGDGRMPSLSFLLRKFVNSGNIFHFFRPGGFFLLIFFCLAATGSASSLSFPAPAGQERINPVQLRLEIELLRLEVSLASSPQLYFLLNLPAKKLQLKARGLVLKEWEITRVRRWGGHPPLQALTLGKKSSLFAPKRKAIVPGEAQVTGSGELETLELKDMPTIFTLNLVEDIKIYVRPVSRSFLSRLANIGLNFRWYGWLPVANLWRQIRKKPLTILEITVGNPNEAKSIYWAMMDGMKGLVFSLPPVRSPDN